MTEDSGAASGRTPPGERLQAIRDNPPFLPDGTLPKELWGDGPWQSEEDRKLWRDETTEFWCMIRRNMSLGILCGYVAVPKGHAAWGVGYDDVDVEVHGGLTWAGHMDGDDWWLGFDCGHAWDILPGLAAREKILFAGTKLAVQPEELGLPYTYKPWHYVEDEVRSLAFQLRMLSP